MEFEITGLFTYPVKSLAANQNDQLIIDDFGFSGDRRFMLVDEEGQFITLRSFPQLSVVNICATENELTLSHSSFGNIIISMSEFTLEKEVVVWRDKVSAVCVPTKRLEKLNRFLETEVYLAFMPNSSFRQVDRDFFSDDKRVSFADAFPFLLTNEASLVDLNSRLEKSIGMERFRPNIVVKGTEAFQEDDWKRIRIGDVEFSVVKPCSRCVATTIDSEGKKTGKEPLKTLATYRKNEFGVCFGQNLVHHNVGVLKIGDKLSVLE